MPQIGRWENLPEGVREHLIDRMRARAISIADLNQLRLWIESQPQVPEGDWYKDFGSFKLCGHGQVPKTFLLRGQVAKGQAVSAVRVVDLLLGALRIRWRLRFTNPMSKAVCDGSCRSPPAKLDLALFHQSLHHAMHPRKAIEEA